VYMMLEGVWGRDPVFREGGLMTWGGGGRRW